MSIIKRDDLIYILYTFVIFLAGISLDSFIKAVCIYFGFTKLIPIILPIFIIVLLGAIFFCAHLLYIDHTNSDNESEYDN